MLRRTLLAALLSLPIALCIAPAESKAGARAAILVPDPVRFDTVHDASRFGTWHVASRIHRDARYALQTFVIGEGPSPDFHDIRSRLAAAVSDHIHRTSGERIAHRRMHRLAPKAIHRLTH